MGRPVGSGTATAVIEVYGNDVLRSEKVFAGWVDHRYGSLRDDGW